MIFKTWVYSHKEHMKELADRQKWRKKFVLFPTRLSFPNHATVVWLETIETRENSVLEREYRFVQGETK